MTGDTEHKKSKKERRKSDVKEEGKSSSKKKHKHTSQDAGTPLPPPSGESSKKHKKQKHQQQEQQQATPQQQQQPDAVASQQQQQQQRKDSSHKKRKQDDGKPQQQQQQQQQAKRPKQQQQTQSNEQQQQVTVTIQVPAASKKAKQQQQQQQAAAAGPWLVYMAAPDPSVYSKLQFKAYAPQDAAAAASKGMVLVSEQQGTTLLGSTRSNINEPAAQFGGYAVGVFDKRTNTLQLAKPAGGSVVRMEALAPKAGPVEVAALSKPAQQSLEQQQLVQAARQGPGRDAAARAEATRLVEAFGSTRRKRQLQQRAEGAVVVQGNTAAAEVDVTMQEVQRRAAASGDTREEIMARLAAHRVVPVHNPLATTPQEAYQARLMFGDALLSAVNMGQMLHAAEHTEDEEKLKGRVPAYVLHRLQRIKEAGSNQAERKRRARLLALLAALLRLAAARPRLTVQPAQPAAAAAEGEEGAEGGRKPRLGGMEGLAASLRIGRQQVLELLLDKFYDKRMDSGKVMYVREAKQEQLLLMHLLVVALDLEGWRMAPQQFEMLRRELKMTPIDVVTRYRELGCTAVAVRIQVPSEGPNDTETTSSYNITLLASGDKNLAQSFPRPKVLKQKQGR